MLKAHPCIFRAHWTELGKVPGRICSSGQLFWWWWCNSILWNPSPSFFFVCLLFGTTRTVPLLKRWTNVSTDPKMVANNNNRNRIRAVSGLVGEIDGLLSTFDCKVLVRFPTKTILPPFIIDLRSFFFLVFLGSSCTEKENWVKTVKTRCKDASKVVCVCSRLELLDPQFQKLTFSVQNSKPTSASKGPLPTNDKTRYRSEIRYAFVSTAKLGCSVFLLPRPTFGEALSEHRGSSSECSSRTVAVAHSDSIRSNLPANPPTLLLRTTPIMMMIEEQHVGHR